MVIAAEPVSPALRASFLCGLEGSKSQRRLSLATGRLNDSSGRVEHTKRLQNLGWNAPHYGSFYEIY
jgi:hypothetical protein